MPKKVVNGAFGPKEDGQGLTASELNDASIYGDGSDGSYTSGDNLTPGQVYHFTDFTLSNGDTLTSTVSNSPLPIIIKVQGDCQIDGTIDLSGKGYQGNEGFSKFRVVNEKEIFTSLRDFRIEVISGPGSNGMPAFRGADDKGQVQVVGLGGEKYPEVVALRAGAGALNAVAGTGGGSGNPGFEDDDSDARGGNGGGGGASYQTSGSKGSEGEGESRSVSSTGSGGNGGSGGGAIVLIVGGDLSGSGTVNVDGADGQDGGDASTSQFGAAAGGGGGGGGAGTAYVLYKGTLTDNLTKSAQGGLGGNGGNASANDPQDEANGGDGGNGGDGTILIEAVQ